MLYLSWGAIALLGIVFLLFVIVTNPVSMPYFKVKLLGGTLLVIKRMNGNFVFRRSGSNDSVLDTKGFGSFISNPRAAARVAGVPGFVAYEGHAVPPTTEAIEAGVELQEGKADVHLELADTATAAAEKGILKPYMVEALYDYANAINPHYVNSRVERKIAESLRNMRTPIGTIFAYVTMLSIFIICAAVAYQMVMSGSANNAVESMANSINM